MIELGELRLNGYGLLIGLGIWLATEVSVWSGKKVGIKKEVIEKGFWWVVGGGLIGARLYHVVDYWEIYGKNWIEILMVWRGGLGIWGAIGGGGVGLLWFYLKNKDRLGLDLFRLLDVAVVGVPLAQAIGRWGNYINGELYGEVTNLPWGIKVMGVEGKVHPLFLYESGLNLGLFALLILVLIRQKGKGAGGSVAGTYLIGYGLTRFFLESLRPEEIVWQIGEMAVAQVVAGVAVLMGIVLVERGARRGEELPAGKN